MKEVRNIDKHYHTSTTKSYAERVKNKERRGELEEYHRIGEGKTDPATALHSLTIHSTPVLQPEERATDGISIPTCDGDCLVKSSLEDKRRVPLGEIQDWPVESGFERAPEDSDGPLIRLNTRASEMAVLKSTEYLHSGVPSSRQHALPKSRRRVRHHWLRHRDDGLE